LTNAEARARMAEEEKEEFEVAEVVADEEAGLGGDRVSGAGRDSSQRSQTSRKLSTMREEEQLPGGSWRESKLDTPDSNGVTGDAPAAEVVSVVPPLPSKRMSMDARLRQKAQATSGQARPQITPPAKPRPLPVLDRDDAGSDRDSGADIMPNYPPLTPGGQHTADAAEKSVVIQRGAGQWAARYEVPSPGPRCTSAASVGCTGISGNAVQAEPSTFKSIAKRGSLQAGAALDMLVHFPHGTNKGSQRPSCTAAAAGGPARRSSTAIWESFQAEQLAQLRAEAEQKEQQGSVGAVGTSLGAAQVDELLKQMGYLTAGMGRLLEKLDDGNGGAAASS